MSLMDLVALPPVSARIAHSASWSVLACHRWALIARRAGRVLGRSPRRRYRASTR